MNQQQSFQIFGILNITPDSFSDGGNFFDASAALSQAQKLIEAGADVLDLGAQSTRPGAAEVSTEQEWERLKNILPYVLEAFPGKISLDTKNIHTAQKFLQIGGTIINDVSGCKNPYMQELIAKYDAQVVVNHFPGDSIQEVHSKYIESISQVYDELCITKEALLAQGVPAHQIILDPGIGFGKTNDLNWQLLSFSSMVPDSAVLIGHSKKRFLGEKRYEKEINIKAAQTAIKSGAKYIRVHNPAWYIA